MPGTRPEEAGTRVFALLGRPVAHSLSPALHNAALRALGLNGVYVALACEAEHLEGLMRGLAAAGGGGNVTLPHKEAAFAALDRASGAARATGACNTFWSENGALCGDNTDVAGFGAAVAALLAERDGRRGTEPGPGRDRPYGLERALVVGAGGAARAAAAWLADGAGEVAVEGRTPARVRALVEALGAPNLRAAKGDADGWDLVVNATPLGLDPRDPAPLAPDRAAAAGAILDMTYADSPNALDRAARAAGVPYADGREMLLHQAAQAFRRWWGQEPPLNAMREGLGEA